MERQPLRSSNIRAVGYDAKAHVLEIEFQNSRVYEYAEVPAAVYDGLMNAPSAGKFFFGRVRGKFVEQEVTPIRQDTMDKGGSPSS